MQRLRQRYRVVTPQTWELARGAYLSGFSARVVAERYGVGEDALRKRARLEGWTKRAYAAARAQSNDGAAAEPPRRREPGAEALDRQIDSAAAPSVTVDPLALSETALARAAEALADGRGAEALAIVKAAEAVGALARAVAEAREEEDTPHEELRARVDAMIWDQAREIAERMRSDPDYELPRSYERWAEGNRDG